MIPQQSKHLTQATWDDVPHLSETDKASLLQSIPPWLRDARTKGIPSMGAGAVYPVPESEVTCEPFKIPSYWPRCYGMDVGWNRTACVWLATDPETQVVYAYTEHYRGKVEPIVHATAIKARGEWIPGVIDPASRASGQKDGEVLFDSYIQHGLILRKAVNAREAGIEAVFELLSTGRLKFFRTCKNLLDEYRLYRRDENGKLVKDFDHCLHPDTLVVTDKGKRAIKDLVGTHGKVLTVGGKWSDYQNCRKTASNQDVVKVSFSDGSSVVCTGDHKFLTSKGWCQAADLKGSACYDAKAETGSAQTNASLSGEEIQGLMTKQGNAQSASQVSELIGIQRLEHVPKNVQLTCLSVEKQGKSDVYCLTVPETACFAVENGVVVHNCMDALRYGVVSGLPIAMTQSKKTYIDRNLVGDPSVAY